MIGLDLRRAKISEYLGVANQTGLSHLLVGNAERAEIIVKIESENLWVVPSGPVPANPAELLLKDKIMEFLTSVASEFDVVVMDTPPIGLVFRIDAPIEVY